MAIPFRLATLLRIRERERDLAAKSVQDAQLALSRLQESRDEIERLHAEMDEERRKSSTGSLTIQTYLDAQRYQMVLTAQATQLTEQMGLIRQELERRQGVLVRCQQSVKSLEKLRTQRQEAADIHEMHRFQEQLDEWANTRYTRDQQLDRGSASS